MSEEHHDHSKHYLKIYWWLLGLFIVSCLGPEIGIKSVTLITAFGIAGVKAYLVIAYFMHLKGEKPFVIYFLTASVGLMFLFYFAVAPDVHNHEGRNWVNVSAKASVERGFETAKKEEAEYAASHGGHHGESHGDEAHGESHGDEAHGESHGDEAQGESHGDEAHGDEAPTEAPPAEPSPEEHSDEGAGH